MKNLTKKCFEENRTKLSFVKESIANGDNLQAIKIVSKFSKLPKSLYLVKEAQEVINNPRWLDFYFKGEILDSVIDRAIIAIQTEYKF